MTEQETEEFTARMIRVWAPVQHIHSHSYGECWEFAAYITQDIALYIDVYASHNQPYFEMRGPGRDWEAAGLRYDEEVFDRCGCEEQEEFTNKWLSYFRRGLWLSGIPIDASTHEKTEWIQGFTREEIEAWNRNF